jgi:hypothetical protein
MKLRLAALAAVAAVAALVGVGVSTASATTPEKTHWEFVSLLPSQVDDSHSGDWAKDKLTRTTIVDKVGPTTFTMKLIDEGTFDTSAFGINPGDGTPLHRTVTGSVTGGATITVQSTSEPKQPSTAGGNTKSSNWAKLVFTGFTGQNSYPWSWTYSTKCEHYTQAAAGESGSITGKLCHVPPTTTPKPPVTTTVTSPVPTTKVVVPPVNVPVHVVVNPGQFAVTPNTSKGVDTGDGSLS